MVFLVGMMCSWYTNILGQRPNVDTTKLKKSRDHDIPYDLGYSSTGMLGGRSKLIGLKAGTRPWRCWDVCMCPGGNHTRVPSSLKLDHDGNPVGDPGFCTTCPVAAKEFIFKFQEEDDKRIFPKWQNGRYTKWNIADVAKEGNEWLFRQGVGRYSHNAGRKALSNWLSDLRVCYKEGMQVHGDLESVWRTRYQKDLEPTNYKVRKQSTDPKLATAALRKFASYCGVGKPKEPEEPLSRAEKLNIAVLKALGQGDLAEKIVSGYD